MQRNWASAADLCVQNPDFLNCLWLGWRWPALSKQQKPARDPEAGLECSVWIKLHTLKPLLKGSAWNLMGGQASGPAWVGLSSPRSWPSCPVSSCFALGPVFFLPLPTCVEAMLTLVPSQELSALLSGDAQEAAGGALGLGPLVGDLSKPLGLEQRERRCPWVAGGPLSGALGFALPCTGLLLAPGGPLPSARESPTRSLVTKAVTFASPTLTGQQYWERTPSPAWVRGTEGQFLINNVLERPMACKCSLTAHVRVALPCSFWGSWLTGGLWGVLASNPRLGGVARAYQPRSLWEKWLALAGAHCVH